MGRNETKKKLRCSNQLNSCSQNRWSAQSSSNSHPILIQSSALPNPEKEAAASLALDSAPMASKTAPGLWDRDLERRGSSGSSGCKNCTANIKMPGKIGKGKATGHWRQIMGKHIPFPPPVERPASWTGSLSLNLIRSLRER